MSEKNEKYHIQLEVLSVNHSSAAPRYILFRKHCTCVDPGNFHRGGPGQTARKQTGQLFFFSPSDFIWDFWKLPFPSHFGKHIIKIGKISTKIHEIGKITAIFGLGIRLPYKAVKMAK